MKVLFYSSKDYELKALNQQALPSHQVTFETLPLNAATAHLAKGYEGVCIFVNDCADAEVLTQLSEVGVKFLLLRCAGFNNVALNAAKLCGIQVARVPQYSPHAVAEHTVALLLTLNRRIHKAYNRVREGNFNLSGLEGFDLFGKTVGVIGAGNIGECFIKIMLGFGCQILVVDPMPSDILQAMPVELVTLDALYARADIISLHCPLTSATHHLINADALKQMKNGVVLLNTSRGAIVDTKAVIQALKCGKIGALALDVYEEEESLFFNDHSLEILQDDVFQRLLSFPNVLITGHQAFLTHEALANIARTTFENIEAFSKGRACPNQVDSLR